MMSPAIHATGMRPHPRRPAWHGVCSMHCGRASPHPPSSNHMTPMSSKNLRRCGHRFRARPMRAHAHPTLPVGAGVGCVVIIMPLHVVSCNFNFPWVIFFFLREAVKRACSHYRAKKKKKATRSGATQLVAPPLFRCFPGNSRSGWQTR